MPRRLGIISAVVALFGLLAACEPEGKKAPVPVYVQLDSVHLNTNFAEEGSAHSDFSTVWISDRRGRLHGVYELPVLAPIVLPEGEEEIRLELGINTNGISSFRAIFDAVEDIILPLDVAPGDTFRPDPAALVTRYNDRYRVVTVEDFDQPGLNFSRSNVSDTNFVKIDDPDSVFQFRPFGATQNEANRNSGMLVLSDEQPRASLASVVAYNVPFGVDNVYLEVTYRTNVRLSFGVVAEFPGREVPALTATLFPQKEWSKIYINLITEVDAYRGASGFKVLIDARKDASVKEGRVFLDNIKLVYP